MVIRYIVLSTILLAVGCSNMPEPPEVTPYAVYEEQGQLYAMPCRVADKNEFTFKCMSTEGVPVNGLFKGWFMIAPGEVASWRRWGKDIYKNYDCKKK